MTINIKSKQSMVERSRTTSVSFVFKCKCVDDRRQKTTSEALPIPQSLTTLLFKVGFLATLELNR